MTAIELKIGDWVVLDNQQKVQIVVLDIGRCSVSTENNVIWDLIPYDEIDGIPLTPEILQKMDGRRWIADGGFVMVTKFWI